MKKLLYILLAVFSLSLLVTGMAFAGRPKPPANLRIVTREVIVRYLINNQRIHGKRLTERIWEHVFSSHIIITDDFILYADEIRVLGDINGIKSLSVYRNKYDGQNFGKPILEIEFLDREQVSEEIRNLEMSILLLLREKIMTGKIKTNTLVIFEKRKNAFLESVGIEGY